MNILIGLENIVIGLVIVLVIEIFIAAISGFFNKTDNNDIWH